MFNPYMRALLLVLGRRFGNFPCIVALLVAEMCCAINIDNYEVYQINKILSLINKLCIVDAYLMHFIVVVRCDLTEK